MASEESMEVAVACVGERLGALRLCESSALEAMQRSLARHGQMTAAVGYRERESEVDPIFRTKMGES